MKITKLNWNSSKLFASNAQVHALTNLGCHEIAFLQLFRPLELLFHLNALVFGDSSFDLRLSNYFHILIDTRIVRIDVVFPANVSIVQKAKFASCICVLCIEIQSITLVIWIVCCFRLCIRLIYVDLWLERTNWNQLVST